MWNYTGAISPGGAILWGLLVLYISTMLFWAGEQVVAILGDTGTEIEYGPDSVQVRIMTIGDNPAIVQQTVEALPASLDDVHVITERDLSITGATTHVVPSSFHCEATRKGRALEWGRRTIECDREFVLYLDEDTQVPRFRGVPDADVVQFGERPMRTDSLITYWIEVFRMGFQVEMRAFPFFDIPMYAWGGGIAIRKSLEDQVTWNFDSLIEDTCFAWLAAIEYDADFAYVNDKFKNQAPPSIRALIDQRRRWFAGSIAEIDLLPPRYFALSVLRNGSWAISVLVPITWIIHWFWAPTIAFESSYTGISAAAFTLVFIWSVIGCVYMGERARLAGLLTVLAPIISVIHALGAFYGAISRPETFNVTEKVAVTGNAPSGSD